MSKSLVETVEALKEKDAFYKMGITIETGERITDHPELFVTYKFLYKCKECAKEWTRFKVEDVEVPKEYVEDEDEKTEYDAEVEEEAGREEQYANE